MLYQKNQEIEDKFGKVFNRYEGFLKTLPSNNPVKLIARIYVVKAYIYGSSNIYGHCNPFLTYKIGDVEIDDRSVSLRSNTLEPIFGRSNKLSLLMKL